MWRQYFKIIGIKPGVVVYPRPFGKIDFRNDNIDPDLLYQIFEAGHPYLRMTDKGFEHFCGDNKKLVTASNAKQSDNKEESNTKPLFKAKDIVQAIEESTTEDQARYYLGLGKEYKSVQKAFDKKIELLNLGS